MRTYIKQTQKDESESLWDPVHRTDFFYDWRKSLLPIYSTSLLISSNRLLRAATLILSIDFFSSIFFSMYS